MTDVVYHGSYTKLNGVRMSEAYASTLNISFDVRGGLLMRQIHHWAAILFMAAIMVHMLRIFFTGAYRKPREFNWLIGIMLFTLGMLEGLFGYSLPDDLLSGTGLRITEGVLLSIPIVGTYLSFFLFGGQFPGNDIIPRLYIIHVLLIPGILLALITAHLFLMFHQKHTQMPGKGRTDRNVVGAPMYPYFMAKTGAFFFFVFGVLALLSTFAQINPIWLYGPYTPAAISAGSQPDFYMGSLEGALRDHARAGPGTCWATRSPSTCSSRRWCRSASSSPGPRCGRSSSAGSPGTSGSTTSNDRPRNAPTRTAIGVAAVAFYGILWLEGANDVIADHFDISLYTDDRDRPVRDLHRAGHRLLGDQADLPGPAAQGRAVAGEHGVETGIIRMTAERRVHRGDQAADGGGAGRAAVPAARRGRAARPPRTADERRAAARRPGACLGKLRLRADRVITESVPLDGRARERARQRPRQRRTTGTGRRAGRGDRRGAAARPCPGRAAPARRMPRRRATQRPRGRA